MDKVPRTKYKILISMTSMEQKNKVSPIKFFIFLKFLMRSNLNYCGL